MTDATILAAIMAELTEAGYNICNMDDDGDGTFSVFGATLITISCRNGILEVYTRDDKDYYKLRAPEPARHTMHQELSTINVENIICFMETIWKGKNQE